MELEDLYVPSDVSISNFASSIFTKYADVISEEEKKLTQEEENVEKIENNQENDYSIKNENDVSKKDSNANFFLEFNADQTPQGVINSVNTGRIRHATIMDAF